MSTDHLEADVLARARVGLSPPEQRRTQLLEQLALGAARAPTELLAPSPDTPSQLFMGEKLRELVNGTGRVMFTRRAMGWALVVGVAVGFGGAHLSGVASRSVSADGAQLAEFADGSEVARRANAARGAHVSDEGKASVTAEPSPVELAAIPDAPDEVSAARVRVEPKAGRGSSPASSKSSEVSFYEELSYVRRAQAALRDGQSALALGLMENLDSLPTKGALWAERSVTKVLALCQLGRADEAKTIAGRVAQADTGKVYRKRLQASCAGAAQ